MTLQTSSEPGIAPKNLLIGFLAGAISVVIFHQGMVMILHLLGLLPTGPWLFIPVPPLGVPSLLSQMFWGGLWGMLFAAIWPHIPGSEFWLKGLIFGIIGPTVIGNWLLVPGLRGRPLFANFAALGLLNGLLIGGAFGIGLALLYGYSRKRI
ncbi:hypothetical protein [Bosea sp. PAMC 26642]|uniref:hypothetical protein n=1 Tax=Bosea sp. (strain PAMC 26642) TaxID=1792307 RepID=UPI00077062C8|nr:hypothetical protein [Bosea sp. PAMC 26642]AMJ59260.1 hypothetical protein AXW83_02145 [Bosea sp. PAMC 26642]